MGSCSKRAGEVSPALPPSVSMLRPCLHSAWLTARGARPPAQRPADWPESRNFDCEWRGNPRRPAHQGCSEIHRHVLGLRAVVERPPTARRSHAAVSASEFRRSSQPPRSTAVGTPSRDGFGPRPVLPLLRGHGRQCRGADIANRHRLLPGLRPFALERAQARVEQCDFVLLLDGIECQLLELRSSVMARVPRLTPWQAMSRADGTSGRC